MKTTRESARERSHHQVVESLQELLQKNYEAEKDYKLALEHAEEEALKEFCKKGMQRHNHFATELDKILHDLNEEPKDPEAHFDLSRTWTNLKTSIGKHHDESLLEECLSGEKKAIKEYRQKLKKHKFLPAIEEVLQKQLNATEAVVSDVKYLEDLRW